MTGKKNPAFPPPDSFMQAVNSLDFSDLLPRTAKGLAGVTRLPRGPGTRGRCRHALLPVLAKAEESHINDEVFEIRVCYFSTTPIASIHSLSILFIELWAPNSYDSSPHS